jgi:hypothetical protein
MTGSASRSDIVRAREGGDSSAIAFLLTAACCRWPPSEKRNAAVRTAAAGVVDWNDFLRQVNRQRVAGLAYEALLSAGITAPPAIAQDLAVQAQNIARRNLSFAAETVRVQRVLETASIPALVLKGVALCQLAYGSLKIKHARDIDLLVSPDHAETAMHLLERDGYTFVLPAQHPSGKQRRALIRYSREAEFIHRDHRLRLELQWRVADNPYLLKGVDAHSATQNVTLVDNVSVRTLLPDDLFAYLCLHGARHAWSRLKWLADVSALIAAHDSDIERIYRHAQRIGAGLCAGQALLLCQRLLAMRLPPNLAEEISASRRVERLVAIALCAMTASNAPTEVDGGVAGVTRSVHTQFLLGEGLAFYLAQCRVASVGPADVIRWPLPGFLHFLYPLLRLPLWLWRRATAALGGRRRSLEDIRTRHRRLPR